MGWIRLAHHYIYTLANLVRVNNRRISRAIMSVGGNFNDIRQEGKAFKHSYLTTK